MQFPQRFIASLAAPAIAPQVLDGSDGAKASDDSWPAFHKSTVHASPIMYDIDFDGVLDILVATYDGEILAIKDTVC